MQIAIKHLEEEIEHCNNMIRYFNTAIMIEENVITHDGIRVDELRRNKLTRELAKQSYEEAIDVLQQHIING